MGSGSGKQHDVGDEKTKVDRMILPTTPLDGGNLGHLGPTERRLTIMYVQCTETQQSIWLHSAIKHTILLPRTYSCSLTGVWLHVDKRMQSGASISQKGYLLFQIGLFQLSHELFQPAAPDHVTCRRKPANEIELLFPKDAAAAACREYDPA